MKSTKAIYLFVAAAFLALSSLVATPASAAPAAGLTADDCIKCHATPPADVAAAGGKHKSEVSCLDCHEKHRPVSKANIPKCTQCHDGKEHYKLKDCSVCHRNPHKPTAISFANNLTDACLGCHKPQIKQMTDNKSKHTKLACSYCHTAHRQIPECTKCHTKLHAATMVPADCKKCHKPHMPTGLTYGQEVPNKDCGSCHKKALELMNATQTKHKDVSCVRCHKDKHKTVPSCEQCHPKPHPAKLLAKFPKCGSCHYIAHDLNNWPAGGEGAAAGIAPAAPAKKKKQ